MDQLNALGTRSHELWRLFEPLHAVTYFSAESRDAFEAAGLRGFWRGYFAGRLGPLVKLGERASAVPASSTDARIAARIAEATKAEGTRMNDTFDQIKAKAADLLGQAGAAAEGVKEKAEGLTGHAAESAGGAKETAAGAAETAKSTLSGAVSEHGPKVTEAVKTAGDFVDEKTGGKSAPVTGAVAGAAEKAVEALGGDSEPAG